MRLVLNYKARLDVVCRYFRKKKADCRLVFDSLFYNHFTNWYTCMDTLMEPFYWFVDHFARYLGPGKKGILPEVLVRKNTASILVVLVVIMVTSVVVIFYTCLLPEKYFRESWVWTAWHLVFGHWLLINVIFNYFMAAFTHPGRPPTAVPEVVSICKKCISPKPPRSHHCSICKNCILKMDHHCPWLNNCVGHYNHRYFFLFCIYIWIGCMYVCVSGYDLFKKHFYGTENYVYNAALYPLNMAYNAYYQKGVRYGQAPLIEKQSIHETVGDGMSYSPHLVFHHCVLYEFMLCSGVGLAVGLLTLWHIKLISSGQTSIEVYINHKEKKRMKENGLLYKNPYHFGFRKNWRLFFGLDCTRSFWRHVLLPSSHYPTGNGLRWETSTYKLDDLSDLYVL